MFNTKIKLSLLPKIGLIIIGLILITFFVDHFIKKAVELRQIRSGIDPKNDPIKSYNQDDFEKYFKDGKLQEGFDFTDIIPFFIGLASVAAVTIGVVGFIVGIAAIVVSSMQDLQKGIVNHYNCAKGEIDDGFLYGWNSFKVLMECSWDKFVKFWNGTCTGYYISDMIYGILHGLFIDLPTILIYAITGYDIGPIFNFIYEMVIVPIDYVIHMITGFHVTKWSDDVIYNCYRCQGSIPKQSGTVSKSFGWWAATMNCSTKQVNDGFNKMFETIFPVKWDEWYKGRHLDGGDWS